MKLMTSCIPKYSCSVSGMSISLVDNIWSLIPQATPLNLLSDCPCWQVEVQWSVSTAGRKFPGYMPVEFGTSAESPTVQWPYPLTLDFPSQTCYHLRVAHLIDGRPCHVLAGRISDKASPDLTTQKHEHIYDSSISEAPDIDPH